MIVILKKRKTHFSHLTHLPAHGQRQQRKKVAKSLLSRLILMRSGRIFAAFSWRPGKLLCGLKTYSDFGRFCYLNIPCFRINTVYYFNLYEFLKRRIHALVGKLKNRCFRWFPAAMFVPQGTQTRRLRTIKFKKHNWLYILNNSSYRLSPTHSVVRASSHSHRTCFLMHRLSFYFFPWKSTNRNTVALMISF